MLCLIAYHPTPTLPSQKDLSIFDWQHLSKLEILFQESFYSFGIFIKILFKMERKKTPQTNLFSMVFQRFEMGFATMLKFTPKTSTSLDMLLVYCCIFKVFIIICYSHAATLNILIIAK
jgi:hypothetical protein